MRRKTSYFAILLVILCTFLTSSGQYFIKIGANNISGSLISIFNPFILGGYVLLGIGMILLVFALKHGELSVLYPFIALSFIWVFLISIFFLQEVIIIYNWIGLVFIILGVSFIGRGAET